jgi:hypothetical protein
MSQIHLEEDFKDRLARPILEKIERVCPGFRGRRDQLQERPRTRVSNPIRCCDGPTHEEEGKVKIGK